jgi:hypothetical protein
MKVIQAYNLDILLHSVQTDTWNHSACLLQFVPGTNEDGSLDFTRATLDFGSNEICERLMSEQEFRDANSVVSFLARSVGYPSLAGMRGTMFESYAHKILAAGGEFRMRWASDSLHTDYQIGFGPSDQRGITQSLVELKEGVSPFTASR